MRHYQELFCICGGTVGSGGRPQAHPIVCPYCRSGRFDVQTLEDIGRKPTEVVWHYRSVVAYKCSNCDYQWNYQEGCPGDEACESGNWAHNTLVDVVPRDSSHYAVIVDLGT